jgi:hypothetical protein
MVCKQVSERFFCELASFPYFGGDPLRIGGVILRNAARKRARLRYSMRTFWERVVKKNHLGTRNQGFVCEKQKNSKKIKKSIAFL